MVETPAFTMPAPDRHENEKTATRFIIVKESREISSGRAANGSEYKMWQLIATKPDGTSIDQNLRSFEDMPRGEVLEVSVTPFVSERWGTSYTVARKNKSKLHSDVEALVKRIEAIEEFLGMNTPEGRREGPGAHQGPPPDPPPYEQQKVAPPPPTISESTQRRDADDIPF